MFMDSKKIMKWVLVGICLGYFVFHPLVMIVGHLMLGAHSLHSPSFSEIIVSEFLMSFSLKMLSWALGFAVLGGLAGLAYGKGAAKYFGILLRKLKQCEGTIRESEKAYQTLAENIPGIVYRVFIRENNRMQFFNNLIQSMTGYSHDELKSGKVCSIEPMIIPEDRPEVIAAVKNAVVENRPFEVEYRLRKRDGDIRWFLERGRPVYGEDGKPLYIDGVIFDIDGRKRAEESALSAQKRLEAVKEIGGLATSSYDLETALQRILKGTIDATGASAGMVFLKDLETGALSWASSIGLSEPFVAEYENRRIQPGEGLTGRIARTGELIYIPEDSSHDPRIARPVIEAEGLNSFVGVPMYAGGDIIGVMNIVSRPPDVLGEQECILCATVGAYVGTAIHNAQLFQQQEQAKEALQEREQYFRSLLDNMHENILVIDKDYRITDVNQSFLAVTGYKREEVIGRKCFEISHGHQEPCEKHGEECRVGEVFKTGKPCNILHEHRNDDGSKCWMDGLLSPLLNEEGEATHVIEAMRNVTDLMEARNRLQESEKHYRTLFNNASEAIFIHDTAGRFLEVNQVACDRLGYSYEDFLKMTVSDLDAPEYSGTLSERIDKLLQLKHMTFESAHVAENGNLIPVEVSSRLIDYAGKPAVLSMVRDISDRKQAEREKEELEKELRQAQKMEAIGTLAGGIAHDFNNILGAVIGLSELALLEVQEETDLHRHIGQVLKAGMRARELVRQILAFSRQREQERVRMSVAPIVKETLKLLRGSLPSTIEIRTYIETDPGIIEGDPTQISQVLVNLCANAEHAMREKGGVLEVGLRKVDLGAGSKELKIRPDLQAGSYVCLSVMDSGHGITPETMNRIFDPYFTTKGVGEGTGLGLAVVQGIVHKHGGAVTVESEVGKGTTFQAYFPLIEGEEEEISEKDQKPVPTGTERILFIDDEEVLTEVGKEILEHLGYDVTVRTSSLEALELFKAKPGYFDVVITDMSMPNMTGEQLSRELMKIRPDIPIILCTGFSHIISKEKARDIGIQAFAMKPLVTKDLAETIRKVLGG